MIVFESIFCQREGHTAKDNEEDIQNMEETNKNDEHGDVSLTIMLYIILYLLDF